MCAGKETRRVLRRRCIPPSRFPARRSRRPRRRLQPAIDLDTAGLERIIGRTGKANGGIYQFTVPRAEKIMEEGMAEGASMGTGTAINFQPLGGGRAAATGDFVLLAGEVDPVMRAMRSGGIEITALHTHMLGEQPTLYFMHFWAVGSGSQLATTLRSALDLTNAQRQAASPPKPERGK